MLTAECPFKTQSVPDAAESVFRFQQLQATRTGSSIDPVHFGAWHWLPTIFRFPVAAIPFLKVFLFQNLVKQARKRQAVWQYFPIWKMKARFFLFPYLHRPLSTNQAYRPCFPATIPFAASAAGFFLMGLLYRS